MVRLSEPGPLRAEPLRRPEWRLQVIRDERELEALEAAWDDLVAHAVEPSPFVTFSWLREWWRAFGEGLEMYLVAVWEGSPRRQGEEEQREARLVGLAPLAYRSPGRRGRPRRTLGFWSNAYSNRSHFLVRENARGVIDAIVTHLAAEAPPWDRWLLEPVLAASPLTRELLAALAARGLRHGADVGLRSPFLALPASFDELLGQLSGGFRQSLRRKARAFDAAPGTGFELRRDAAALEQAFAVAEESWQHAEGTSIASTEPLRGFYRGVTAEAARHGWLQIALLEQAGETISFEYNLVFRDVVYNLKLGYRAAFARDSPGLVLKQRVLRHAIEAGLVEYDFLGAEESYKTRWSSGVRDHLRITVFDERLASRAEHFYRYRVKPAARRRLPGAVRLKNALAARLRGPRS